jgi:hypothetical protein
VIEYFIPPSVEIDPHNPIFAHVNFYNSDVKAHKERMSKEILHAFLICKNYGIPNDLTKHFVNKYIKRGVEYGNHKPQADNTFTQTILILSFAVCTTVLIMCLIMWLLAMSLLSFSLQPMVAQKLYDHDSLSPLGPLGMCNHNNELPVFKCIEQDGRPPKCEYVIEHD